MRSLLILPLLIACNPPTAKDSFTHIGHMEADGFGGGVKMYAFNIYASPAAREMETELRGYVNGPLVEGQAPDTALFISLGFGLGQSMEERSDYDSSEVRIDMPLDLMACDEFGLTPEPDGGCTIDGLITAVTEVPRTNMTIKTSIRGWAPDGWSGNADDVFYEVTMTDVTNQP